MPKGKILGAGGGGYFIFFAKPKKHPEIIKNLSHLQLIILILKITDQK